MREIVLDTETTGLDPNQGHRLVELGCIELLNRIPTGATFHRYLNPQREMPAEAFAIHGLATEFLSDKPLFADIVDDFLEFIGDAPLVIHNASFDHGFLIAELKRVERPLIARERLVDTLLLARRKHPAGPQPARRPVRALRHRQFAAHQARRAARRRDPGRGLSGADRRAPGAARPRRERHAARFRPRRHAWRGANAARLWPRASATRIARRTAISWRAWAIRPCGGITGRTRPDDSGRSAGAGAPAGCCSLSLCR